MPNFGGMMGVSMGMIKGFLVTNITKAPEDKLREELDNLVKQVQGWIE